MQRTWTGGGSNNASNPKDWSPTGAPRPGDTLIDTIAAPMHVSGNDLAGNTVTVGGGWTDTPPTTATFDTTNGASLNLTTHWVADFGYNTINLNDSGIVNLNVILASSTFNTHGGTLHFIGTSLIGQGSAATINSNIYGPATLDMDGAEAAGSVVTLGGDVGQRVTVNLDTNIPVDQLILAHPTRFFGLLDFTQDGG